MSCFIRRIIDKDVFEILGYNTTIDGSNVSIALSSELGWDYSAVDPDVIEITLSYDQTKLTYVDSALEGTLSQASDNSSDQVGGQVMAAMGHLGSTYAADGGLFGTFNFTKSGDDPVKVDITVFEAGLLTGSVYDYPVGFTIEV